MTPQTPRPACAAPDCERPATAKGHCPMHWSRIKRTGTLELKSRPRTHDQGECAVDGCTRQKHTRGWCAMHYSRFNRNGTTDPIPVKAGDLRPHGTSAARKRHRRAGEDYCDKCAGRVTRADDLAHREPRTAAQKAGDAGVQSAGYGVFRDLDALPEHLANWVRRRRARMARAGKLAAFKAAQDRKARRERFAAAAATPEGRDYLAGVASEVK